MLDPRFDGFKNFVFDLDGTVWNWKEVFPGAPAVFSALKASGKRFFFATNNTLLTLDGFVEKLRNMGIAAERGSVINPSVPARSLLKGKRVFCIGEGLVSELRKSGIKVVPSKADAVLIGTDRGLSYEKLAAACEEVRAGAEFYKVASEGSFLCGTKILPGAGAIAALVEKVTGVKSVLIGKPSDFMAEAILSLGLEPEKTVLIGDDCSSDIALGEKLGFTTVFVKTGIGPECEADMVLGSIAEIVR